MHSLKRLFIISVRGWRINSKASLINDIGTLSGLGALFDGRKFTILRTTSYDTGWKRNFSTSAQSSLCVIDKTDWGLHVVTIALESADALAPTEVKNSLNSFARTLTFWENDGHDVSSLVYIQFYMKKRQMAFYEYGKNSYAFKYWRNKVNYAVKQARKTYYSHSVEKLKNTNPTRWWKEIKATGSLSSHATWHSQLLSETIPTCGHVP